MTLPHQELTLLDHLLPVWDGERVERRVLPVSQAQAYDAALQTDFLDVVRDSRVVRTLFALRSGVERVVAFLRRRPFREPAPPMRLRLMDLPATGAWMRLGTDRPREFAFGVAGRFWTGETRWVELDNTSFTSFTTPGYARVACHLHFAPLAPGRTKVTYIARARTNDPKSRDAFEVYWMLVAPFVGIIMRVTLKAIERTALRHAAGREVMPHAAVMHR